MIRVTLHTAHRALSKPCQACEHQIIVGERYRELVAVGETDVFNAAYVRFLAHDSCVSGSERWETREVTPHYGDPTCEYVRNAYGLDVRRGVRVTALGSPGVVMGGTNHVWVKSDQNRHALPYHPHDVVLAPPATSRRSPAVSE